VPSITGSAENYHQDTKNTRMKEDLLFLVDFVPWW
jgi:hypothetical protein